MADVVNWFEIPVSDFARAKRFYEAILGAPLYELQMGPHLMGFFPMEGEGVGGALVQGEGYTPRASGTMVYLNGGADLSAFLPASNRPEGQSRYQRL